MGKIRILYVASEIAPFLQTSSVGSFTRQISEAMQERGMEIRILAPRFGTINERRNKLHEVVRLSGINISIGDDEKPLVIKVASIPNSKLQVYFIDNEDYFSRKAVFYDEQQNFFQDNDERAIFFCKGVLETVRKLGWSPNIIHCHDWMTSIIPLYIRSTYHHDPVFRNTKTIFSLYNTAFPHLFSANLIEKIKTNDITSEILEPLTSLDYEGFIKLGLKYADLSILSTCLHEQEDMKTRINAYAQIHNLNYLSLEQNENPAEVLYNLYHELQSVPVA
ncbi:MAG: glycogen/starch synthase [Microscillaceae bacterium]|nr:glycogen/starch synthase [Microscillaceae bacterium]MDW8459833.1 glycogen/starch synthase [Cytophagales bacterium]